MTAAIAPELAGAGQASDPLLEVKNLGKVYRGRGRAVTALADFDLSVGPGTFLSIVGPSGCGKSTLLKLLAGLTPKTSGSVRLQGHEVDQPNRETGLMFQTPVLFAWRTVLDNVLLPIEIFKRRKSDYVERAEQLLETVGLGGRGDSYPRELSGGMQQRVSLCRLLLYKPKILLLDEPFGALDELTRETLDFELQSLWASEGLTVVLVTHNVAEAVLLSNEVAVMSPAPSRVQRVIPIDLPRPRSGGTMRSQRYSELLFTVREELNLT